MQQYKSEAVALLDAFYKTTGIGALCLDTQMNMVACVPAGSALHDSSYLAMSQITAFLREVYTEPPAQPEAERRFYTFFMDFNFISNIVPIRQEGEIVGALVTELVRVKKLGREEAESLLDRKGLSPKDRKELESILMRLPVVPYDRLMPMGRILYGLSTTLFPDAAPQQILRRASKEASAPQPLRSGHKKDLDIPEVARHSPFSIYLRVKETIQSGNTAGLLETMNRISAGSVPMDQLNRSDFVRSVKDSFIKSCALGCYAAIEGNAPYERVMDLSDEFIRRMETLDNIYDIYDLMKNAMLSFSRTVSVSGALYSKPVRRILEYIGMFVNQKVGHALARK